MKPLPHLYSVVATAAEESDVELESNGVTPIMSAPPAEFGGPGDHWSPETLLVGAVADCFVLTFRSIARASRLKWTNITCEGTGRLDRLQGITRFVGIDLHVTLTVATDVETQRARALLEKAETTCLVANSLLFDITLQTDVKVEAREPAETPSLLCS